jgi:DNA repair exonuclease SbcCD ATPase subunit
MKLRFVLPLLFVSLMFGFAVSARADKASDIANVKNQIATLENETPAMLKTLETLKAEKENQIDFVGAAYDKAEANYEQSVAAYNQKNADVKRQYQLLEPALENYKQRVDQHNANQCTEKCVNGSCDGSCAWYTAEKNQLDNNQAQLQQAYAPIDAAARQLQSESADLDQTKGKLEEIRTNLNSEIESWKGKIAQLKAQWEEHEAQLAKLNAELAILYGSVNNCMQEVNATPECQRPAIGPDGKPILDQNCEEMKAQCSKMFDGNR